MKIKNLLDLKIISNCVPTNFLNCGLSIKEIFWNCPKMLCTQIRSCSKRKTSYFLSAPETRPKEHENLGPSSLPVDINGTAAIALSKTKLLLSVIGGDEIVHLSSPWPLNTIHFPPRSPIPITWAYLERSLLLRLKVKHYMIVVRSRF